MKEFLARVLYYFGCVIRRNPKLLSLYFHDVKPDPFEKELKWLVGHGYSFISMAEVIGYLSGKRKIEGKKALLTFDDGRLGNLSLVPLLEKYKVPITIFCATQPVTEGGGFWWDYVKTKYNSQVKVEEFKTYTEERFNKEMAKLHADVVLERQAFTVEEMARVDTNPYVDIQSHTVTHPILTSLSDEHLENELKESKAQLESYLGKKIYAFSYPNGSLTEREVNAVRKIYDCAVTTEEEYPEVGCDLYRIPRIVQTEDYWTNLARVKKMWKVVDLVKRWRIF